MGDWLDGLLGAGDQIGADIVGFLNYFIGLLVALFSYLWDLIVSAVLFLYHLLLSVGQFLHTLWDDFFKGIFQNLWSAILKVHAWLESILSPIIKFLQQVRQWVDWYFNTYVKPFLNILIHIRQFLEILRAFGVKWAAQLDAILGKVEADIAGAFLQIHGILTGLIDIAQVLADPLNLLRRPTLVLSVRRIVPTVVRAVTGLPLGYFLPSPSSNAPLGLGFMPLNFDPTNPAMNPPASSYFSTDDGLGSFGGFANGDVPPDSAVDDLTILDYFDDGLYPPPECSDLNTCIQQMVLAGSQSVPAAQA